MRKSLPIVRDRHLCAKRSHHRQRHLDVGLRDQLSGDFDLQRVRHRAFRAHGATNSSALRNWLEILPRTVALRPAMPAASTITGGQPLAASLRGADAELRERVEQIANRPLVHSRRAAQPKRAAAQGHQRREKPHRRAAVGDVKVCLRRRNTARRSRRPGPCAARNRRGPRPPIAASASIITRVSSLSRMPASVDVPSASAAHTSALFVRLLDPGGRMVASGVDTRGWISMLDMFRTGPASRDRCGHEHATQGAAIFHKCSSLRTYSAPSTIAGELWILPSS